MLAPEPKPITRSPQNEPRPVPSRLPVRLRINGADYTLHVEPWVTLLDLLREQLDLTGTKKGCDHGQCGACTILADGRRINACLALAVAYDQADITTVEGLALLAGDGGALHPLQQAFIECDAFQCGYCTPGQLCSAAGLLNETPPRNVPEIRERMSGNLCRCGAYPQIVEAVSRVVLNGRARDEGARQTENAGETAGIPAGATPSSATPEQTP
ncbi:(2Fe-2S)-binding protein [Cupriavidus gilardii]|uniref:(2Fe-2S)-binding protein n=1 Tax=Cupriavidus gilardii TaxID=82541 RepID=UPI0021BFE913|nr:(2Fe-2S)-binding protein [Cupriavidus gilardii]MCT9124942.1 (2Fe-2S)-binding protein [Cupriavidus gilardii]